MRMFHATGKHVSLDGRASTKLDYTIRAHDQEQAKAIFRERAREDHGYGMVYIDNMKSIQK